MKGVEKFVTAAVGAVLTAVSLGLIPGAEKPWVTVAIAFLTALGVYVVPNSPQAP